MPTKFPEFFAALAAEFKGSDVKKRPQSGRQLSYITARTVMIRLDEVVGPEGWWDEYQPMEHSVLCRLTIRLPDGTTVTKCDAGGYAGMTDQGDDDKSGFSDAFKRAAVKFGVGRHLYQDGTARLEPPAPPPPTYKDWLDDYCRNVNEKAGASLVSTYQLNRHLLKALGTPGSKSEADNLKAGERHWRDNHEAMRAEARVYCKKLWLDRKAVGEAMLGIARDPGADMPSDDEHAVLDELAATGTT